MRAFRFSIAGLMGTVLVAAFGVAALRAGSANWAGAIFLLTSVVLGLGLVGLVCGKRTQRAWWLGFSSIGWGYLILGLWTLSSHQLTLPTERLLRLLATKIGPSIGPPGDPFELDRFGPDSWSIDSFMQIGQCLLALGAAIVGGLLARAFFRDAVAPSESEITRSQSAAPMARGWWLKPAVIGLIGLAVETMAVAASSRLDPSLRAGMILLLTSGLICLACLGTFLSRGKSREIWLGAALFGGFSMIVTFVRSTGHEGMPDFPTVRFLNAARPWLPATVSGLPAGSFSADAANARIRKKLEQPATMRFHGERLENVVTYVRSVTKDQDGTMIQVYVDPRPPGAAEGLFAPNVWIELEGIPLKTSLRLCLKQIDLTYDVRDGLLLITSEEGLPPIPLDNAYLIIGHCVLAVIAAVVGGVLAPVVSDLRPVPTS
jgi:hypothetical protein